jgi:hypothetical protein
MCGSMPGMSRSVADLMLTKTMLPTGISPCAPPLSLLWGLSVFDICLQGHHHRPGDARSHDKIIARYFFFFPLVGSLCGVWYVVCVVSEIAENGTEKKKVRSLEQNATQLFAVGRSVLVSEERVMCQSQQTFLTFERRSHRYPGHSSRLPMRLEESEDRAGENRDHRS